jgi:hypothetical protein
MSAAVLAGDTSGSITLQAPAVAGSTVLTLPATTGTVLTTTGGVTPGTSGNLLTSNGTTWVSSAPPASSQWVTTGSNIYYSTGNVGIGTTAPAYTLEVKSGTAQFAFSNTGSNPRLGFAYNNTAENGEIHSYSLKFFTSSSGTFSGTQKMILTNIGQLSLGSTSPVSAGWLTLNYDGQNYNGLMTRTTTSGTYYGAMFKNVSDAFVGNISVSASATAYNTSSDYRLKDNVAPMTGALARVALLKPVTYSWKIDGSAGEGFIAHELQEVCPLAVTGEKDAVFEDGSVKSQSIDVSFLVATLTAAIQEQQALIENLTTRLAALENK